MNVTFHAMVRYCQRIENMDEKAAKYHATENKENYTNKVLEIFSGSRRIFSGSFNGHTECDFYINDDIVLVVRNEDILTLYPTEYGFTEKLNRSITKELVQEIDRLQKKLEKANEKQQEVIQQLESKKEALENEISVIKAKLDSLEQKKRLLEMEKEVLTGEQKAIMEEIKNIAYKLCYSMNFKADVMAKAVK